MIESHFYEALIKNIGNEYYSLLIDKSIIVDKILGIIIRYYSTEQKKIISTFFKSIHIEDGTAESIINNKKSY